MHLSGCLVSGSADEVVECVRLVLFGGFLQILDNPLGVEEE